MWKEDNEESISLSLFQQECMKQLHGEDEIRKMENIPQKPTVRTAKNYPPIYFDFLLKAMKLNYDVFWYKSVNG